VVDVTSADWIVEAPSECLNNNYCRTPPSPTSARCEFTDAGAQTTSQRGGSISSHVWGSTKITLAPSGCRYIAYGTAAAATPSALQDSGASFKIAYAQTTPNPGPPMSASRARPTTNVQPGGARR
jgi:hypothetical protein